MVDITTFFKNLKLSIILNILFTDLIARNKVNHLKKKKKKYLKNNSKLFLIQFFFSIKKKILN